MVTQIGAIKILIYMRQICKWIKEEGPEHALGLSLLAYDLKNGLFYMLFAVIRPSMIGLYGCFAAKYSATTSAKSGP